MNVDFLKRLMLFLGLLLAQVLVLNHIHLFGVATPLLYVYFVICFRRAYPKWAILTWSFMLGLCVDMFSNTPGVAAASMTFTALLQPYILELFMVRDDDDELLPCVMTLGMAKYTAYASILTAIYCLAFFTVETFTFFNWLQWLLSVVTSSALTLLLVVVVDNLRRN